MGGPIQKKKNKSSLPKIRQKPKSKRFNINSNPIVAANWNPTQTLSQNYTRLGLTSKLSSRAGGTEPSPSPSSQPPRPDTLSLHPTPQRPGNYNNNNKNAHIVPGTVRVLRDPETGAIIRVIRATTTPPPPPSSSGEMPNPLNDALNGIEVAEWDEGGCGGGGAGGKEPEVGKGGYSGKQREQGGGIVRELEDMARKGAKGKRVRVQSRREVEWVGRLVGKWGGDFGAMVRDRRLNPGQQSEGDLRRRVRMWRAGKGSPIG